MSGKLYVEFYNEKGLLYDRLVYDAVIVGTGSMLFELLGNYLINLPSKFIRGEFKSDGHKYVLAVFKHELMEVTGMDVDLCFVPSKIVQES